MNGLNEMNEMTEMAETTGMSRQRENNLDVLRIICTLAIIALHTGSGYAEEYTLSEPESYFIVGNAFHTLTRFAVPCFIMLSGAFLLSDSRNLSWRYFYRKSYRQLGRPLLAVSVLYVMYTYMVYSFQYFYQGAAVDWQKPLYQLVTGNPFFHLWYMYMLGGLYLLTPLLIKLRQQLSAGQYRWLWLLLLAGGIVANNIYAPQVAWGLLSLYYLGYFLWGDIMHQTVGKGGSSVYWLGGLVSLGAILYIKQVQVLAEPQFMACLGNVLDPLNLLAAAAGLCIFGGFCRWRCDIECRRLAGLTYYIYLSHALWLHLLWNLLKLTHHKADPLYIIPLLIGAVSVLAYLSSDIVKRWQSGKNIKTN